ncbi:DNA polymerase Y family protein, partial [Escherichia coli]
HPESAIAGTRGAAHALARNGGGIVPDGRLIEGIGRLPVTALRANPETAEALARVGLARIADLAHLPRAPLARRFGQGLVLRLDQALGFVPEPIEPIYPEHLPRARRGFMEPIATPEAFAQVIGDLV